LNRKSRQRQRLGSVSRCLPPEGCPVKAWVGRDVITHGPWMQCPPICAVSPALSCHLNLCRLGKLEPMAWTGRISWGGFALDTNESISI